ncbi:TetR/AcrR family transcriptional regulator [Nitratireductor soli]|uniref:TetR/AcrR family transcriptional regulator n=1 Tax=Nitratireductor soli TaxID=1670619 RepID=UPI00065E6A96|nr:TetR/AcrR family transcriptional regulator [Nitratireductor soli]
MHNRDLAEPGEPLSRKEKQRQATQAEIRSTARRLLVKRGGGAVTINAIARRMGLSGPALYRYYPSQAALIEALRADFYSELIATMQQAGARSTTGLPGDRLLATSRALRGWATAHPAEFGWLFASPATAVQPGPRDAAKRDMGQAFGQVFLEQIVRIWQAKRFPIQSLEDMPTVQAEQLRAFSEKIDGLLPPEAAHVFLACWMRLYGLLCMEIFRQIDFAYGDMTPVYEECLRELCQLLDVAYTAPDA